MSSASLNPDALNRAHRRKMARDERRGVDTDAPDYFPTVEPIVVRPDTAMQMLDCGHSRLYDLINSGELDSFTDGARRYITTESIYRHVARRLAAANKTPARSNAASVASRKAARAQVERC
jgi:hypothetical protein